MQVPGGPTEIRGMQCQSGIEHATTLEIDPMRRAGGSFCEFQVRHFLPNGTTQNDLNCDVAEYLSPSVVMR
jgi:hypothetical protein